MDTKLSPSERAAILTKRIDNLKRNSSLEVAERLLEIQRAEIALEQAMKEFENGQEHNSI